MDNRARLLQSARLSIVVKMSLINQRALGVKLLRINIIYVKTIQNHVIILHGIHLVKKKQNARKVRKNK